MTFTVERVPGVPAVIMSYEDDFSFTEEGDALMQELYAVLDATPEPLYMINVEMMGHMSSFNEVLSATSKVTRGDQPLLQHPNLRKPIWVTNSKLALAVVRGLNTVTFGNVDILVFNTLEEALGWVRENAA